MKHSIKIEYFINILIRPILHDMEAWKQRHKTSGLLNAEPSRSGVKIYMDMLFMLFRQGPFLGLIAYARMSANTYVPICLGKRIVGSPFSIHLSAPFDTISPPFYTTTIFLGCT